MQFIYFPLKSIEKLSLAHGPNDAQFVANVNFIEAHQEDEQNQCHAN